MLGFKRLALAYVSKVEYALLLYNSTEVFVIGNRRY